MFDKFCLPTLIIGLFFQIIARYADSAGLITPGTRGILYGISLFFIALGLFFFGRIVGKAMLQKAREKLRK